MRKLLCLLLILALTLPPLPEAGAAVRVIPKTTISASPAPVSIPAAADVSRAFPGPLSAAPALAGSLSAVRSPQISVPQSAEISAQASEEPEANGIAEIGPAGAVAGEARERRGDLSPAGPHRRLTYADLARLPVAWKDVDLVAHTYQNLQFLLSEDLEDRRKLFDYLKEHPDRANDIFEGMFLSLESILAGGLPGVERAQIAVSLSNVYAGFLAQVAGDRTLSESVRSHARENVRNFHVEERLVTELLRKREAEDKLARLRRMVGQITGSNEEEAESVQAGGAQEEGRQEPAINTKPPWHVGERNLDRVREDGRRTTEFSMDSYAKRLENALFYTEKLWLRFSLAYHKGFSQAFVEARAKELSDYLDDAVLPMMRAFSFSIPRYAMMSLGQTYLGFNNRTRPDHLWIPDNPNLRMEVAGGEVTVKARFETDIPSDKVLKAIKESIEHHWRGTFRLEGRPMRFKTEVAIVRVAPGGFSADSLWIIEDEVSHSIPRHIALSREFGWDVPAHEFGHILGLPDEYTEYYDGEKRAGYQTSNPGSLMGESRHGIVQPRLLEKAFRLLEKNSIR